MSYAMAGALGADDCVLNKDCWRACMNTPRADETEAYATHKRCLGECKEGPGCQALPVASKSKLLLIGGGVLAAGIVAFLVIRKK